MKRSVAALVAVLCLGVSPSVVAQSADQEAIQAIITSFSDIWARADVQAFENLFTEDAEFVNRSGVFLNGRAEVVAHHATLMTRNFMGSRVIWQTLDLRFVRPDIAIAHVAAELTLRDGTKRPNGTVTIVFVREAAGWKITAVQNTDRVTQ